MAVNPKRVRQLQDGRRQRGPVVYWMSRDQRSVDNWALLFAQQEALEHKVPLVVAFCLVPAFLSAAGDHFRFMLAGLASTAEVLREKRIPFHLLEGQPQDVLPRFLVQQKTGCLVTDFDPLRIKREWKERVARSITLPFYEVDAHNIVPCWHVSQKQEYGAYTMRPKIQRNLAEFLVPFPRLKTHPFPSRHQGRILWEGYPEGKADSGGHAIGTARTIPGQGQALNVLRAFIKKGLSTYSARRNDPNLDGQSGLSPYLHFGHISAQRVALEVMKSGAARLSRAAFLEELIVRRELSDNFCLYNPSYDTFEGFPEWARKTLEAHRSDRRVYLYPLRVLENAETHDDLWNAAQKEMAVTGRMHGYLRMYWAKKILEWSEAPEQALSAAIYLNNRYELDGRDPNGYAGIAWSIGGVHDRAWNERPIFGKIRYMSYNGCKSKFDVKGYIRRVERIVHGREDSV